MKVMYIRTPRRKSKKVPTVNIMEFKRYPGRSFRRKLGYRWVSIRLSPWWRAFVKHPASADALAMGTVASTHLMSRN